MKKTVICVMVFLILITIGGCVRNIDGKHKGYSNGFNFTGPRYSSVMYAVRSDKQEFEIDDVVLDFYCGWFSEPHYTAYDSAVSFVFFATSREAEEPFWFVFEPIDDYRNIENHYLIAEVPASEFETKDYVGTQTYNDGKRFGNSGMSIKIPKEAFTHQQGTIIIYACEVTKYEEDDKLFYLDYYSQFYYPFNIRYKKNTNNIVQLLK